jgi:hypothetical protein
VQDTPDLVQSSLDLAQDLRTPDIHESKNCRCNTNKPYPAVGPVGDTDSLVHLKRHETQFAGF